MNALSTTFILLVTVGFIFLLFYIVKKISSKINHSEKTENTLDIIFGSLFSYKVFGSLFFIGGLWVLFKQIFVYLKFGFWESCSLSYCQVFNTTFFQTQWIGLNDVLDFVPLSVFLFLIGFIIFLLYRENN